MDNALFWFVLCVVGVRIAVFGAAMIRDPDRYPRRLWEWSERRSGAARLRDPFRFRPGAYSGYYRWCGVVVLAIGLTLATLAVRGALGEVFG